MINIEKAPSGVGQEIKSESKQDLWDRQVMGLEAVEDRLGMKMDENIKETVVALGAQGFSTSSSCGGHLEEGRVRLPYVHICAKGKPANRFVGEEQLKHDIVAKYSIAIEDITRGVNGDADVAYDEGIDGLHDETDEYKAWYRKNESDGARLAELIEDFYRGVKVPNDIGLTVRRLHEFSSLESSARQTFIRAEGIPVTMVSLSQKELEGFTQFLKDRYFREDT